MQNLPMQNVKAVLIALFLCLAGGVSAYAQSPAPTAPPAAASPEAQLLRTLIEEVRLMRLSQQRSAANLWRAQFLNERLARQQTRVETLAEQLESFKQEMRAAHDTSELEAELKELEAAYNETQEPRLKAELFQNYQGHKRTLARLLERIREEADATRQRQLHLENNLRLEQGKLAELQEKAEALEREIETTLVERRNAP